ncbi:uncharacterized protein LOC114193395 [Vigna unguiculata]|uniref:uncharacterized protein LOC114193395 n=1 Tax=Vigna unguiculata TaxID=3917 RepID=UPI0010171A12|nr:uncharacterized protein LOC114193395 [Vigna unguiculata]
MYFTYTKLININITTTITLSLFDREFGEAPKPTTSTHFHGNMTTSKAALARYLALCSTYPPPLLVLVCLCCTQAYGGLGRNLLLLCFIINNVAMLVVDMVIIGDVFSRSCSGVHNSGVVEEWFDQCWCLLHHSVHTIMNSKILPK